MPRPLQVSPVCGWRYLGATARLATGAPALRRTGALGARTDLAEPKAAAISSGVILYSRIDLTIDAITGLRRRVCRASALCLSLVISFSILACSTA
ncbi:Uncharacterised protein [Bordetella pertussis]|nr:Uncharacterised protein [Bordetella pertussis]